MDLQNIRNHLTHKLEQKDFTFDQEVLNYLLQSQINLENILTTNKYFLEWIKASDSNFKEAKVLELKKESITLNEGKENKKRKRNEREGISIPLQKCSHNEEVDLLLHAACEQNVQLTDSLINKTGLVIGLGFTEDTKKTPWESGLRRFLSTFGTYKANSLWCKNYADHGFEGTFQYKEKKYCIVYRGVSVQKVIQYQKEIVQSCDSILSREDWLARVKEHEGECEGSWLNNYHAWGHLSERHQFEWKRKGKKIPCTVLLLKVELK